MNLQEEIKIMKERITELEELVKKEQDFPQDGDEYYVLTGTCSVVPYVWVDDNIDFKSQAIGNIFRTKEQAEFAVEKLKVEAELRKLSVSWDLEKTQYTFSFNWEAVEFEIEYPDYNQYPGSYYFDSFDSLQQALETVGEGRIKKYIFEVKQT